jgi:hypothetical protein
MKKILASVAGLGAAALVLTGCSFDKSTEPFKDAPRQGSDASPAKVIQMPDGFNNLATKCVDGVRYTVIFHANDNRGAVSTILDPSCPKA